MTSFLKEYEWVAVWVFVIALLVLIWRIWISKTIPRTLAPSTFSKLKAIPCDPAWGTWFRDNSDKYLIVMVLALLLMYNLHIMHHGGDREQLSFINGLINGLEGAFLTLVTGAVMRKSATASTTTEVVPAGGKSTTDTVAKTEAVKIEQK